MVLYVQSVNDEGGNLFNDVVLGDGYKGGEEVEVRPDGALAPGQEGGGGLRPWWFLFSLLASGDGGGGDVGEVGHVGLLGHLRVHSRGAQGHVLVRERRVDHRHGQCAFLLIVEATVRMAW